MYQLAGSISVMATERRRRRAEYASSVAAVLASLDGEDADLYDRLDDADTAEALAPDSVGDRGRFATSRQRVTG